MVERYDQWHCVEHCGAWSFLLAATNMKTALPFPLCCERHMLFFPPYTLRNKTQINFSYDRMSKRNLNNYVQIESLSQKTENCNQNIHLCHLINIRTIFVSPFNTSSFTYITQLQPHESQKWGGGGSQCINFLSF